MHWNKLFSTVEEREASVGAMMLVLILDTVIYAFLAYYFDSIFPGRYGVGKPWNFICKVCTRCSCSLQPVFGSIFSQNLEGLTTNSLCFNYKS